MAVTERWGGLRPEPYNPDARDADGDGIVQEGTAWERPANTFIFDAAGREIRSGMVLRSRPGKIKIVDRNGRAVSYTPSYLRGVQATEDFTAARLGVPSLRDQGRQTIGEMVYGPGTGERVAAIGEAIARTPVGMKTASSAGRLSAVHATGDPAARYAAGLMSDTLELVDSLHYLPDDDVGDIEFEYLGALPDSDISAQISFVDPMVRTEGAAGTTISLYDGSRHEGAFLFNLMHEMGHRSDAYVDDDGRLQFYSMQDTPAVTELFAAIQELPSWERRVEAAQLVAYLNSDPEFVDYFLSRQEVFARLYAQWVAHRTRNPRLAAGLAREMAMQDEMKGLRQWTDREFKTLLPYLDAVFSERGLLRPDVGPERAPLEPEVEGGIRIAVPDMPEFHGQRMMVGQFGNPEYALFRDALDLLDTGITVRGEPISWEDEIVPDVVYHVSPAIQNIMSDGMIRASGGYEGLGGDDKDQIVSMTTDLNTALSLMTDLYMISEMVYAGNQGNELASVPGGADMAWALLRDVMMHNSSGVKIEWDRLRDIYNRDGLGPLISAFFAHRESVGRRDPGSIRRKDPMILGLTQVDAAKRQAFLDRFALLTEEDFGIAVVPRERLATGALLTDFDVGRDGLEEIRLYGDIDMRGSGGGARFMTAREYGFLLSEHRPLRSAASKFHLNHDDLEQRRDEKELVDEVIQAVDALVFFEDNFGRTTIHLESMGDWDRDHPAEVDAYISDYNESQKPFLASFVETRDDDGEKILRQGHRMHINVVRLRETARAFIADLPKEERVDLLPRVTDDEVAAAIVHETGHVWDQVVTSEGKVRLYSHMDTPATLNLFRAVAAQPRWKQRLDRLQTYGYYGEEAWAGSREEIWARLHFQYVATRTQNQKLLRSLRRSRELRRLQENSYPQQFAPAGFLHWEDDEFEELIPWIEAVYAERGLLKNSSAGFNVPGGNSDRLPGDKSDDSIIATLTSRDGFPLRRQLPGYPDEEATPSSSLPGSTPQFQPTEQIVTSKIPAVLTTAKDGTSFPVYTIDGKEFAFRGVYEMPDYEAVGGGGFQAISARTIAELPEGEGRDQLERYLARLMNAPQNPGATPHYLVDRSIDGFLEAARIVAPDNEALQQMSEEIERGEYSDQAILLLDAIYAASHIGHDGKSLDTPSEFGDGLVLLALTGDVDAQNELARRVAFVHQQDIEVANEERKIRAEHFAENAQYLPASDLKPSDVSMVHATGYFPERDDDGNLTIGTRFSGDGFPRASVHFAVNHLVKSHMQGDWDSSPYVIIGPLDEMMTRNGAPRSLHDVDSWWLANPGERIHIPGGLLIRPAKSGTTKLFDQVGDEIFYKTTDFEKDDIDEMLQITLDVRDDIRAVLSEEMEDWLISRIPNFTNDFEANATGRLRTSEVDRLRQNLLEQLLEAQDGQNMDVIFAAMAKRAAVVNALRSRGQGVAQGGAHTGSWTGQVQRLAGELGVKSGLHDLTPEQSGESIFLIPREATQDVFALRRETPPEARRTTMASGHMEARRKAKPQLSNVPSM